ncbi:MAG TPA: S8 family serine peptidase, partial [Thermomicrobiales bacterium]
SDLLRGLQWCYNPRAGYGSSGPIRVVSVSMSAGTAESYKTSPVCAAVEQLWFGGVVVVVAAGNRGSAGDATWYPPANDPYVVTVGAYDDNLTLPNNDDSQLFFSSRGKTQDGFAKPDVLAPGRKIVSTLASATCTLARQFPGRITDASYIRLSGTSMATPMAAGMVALLLARYPKLTPNQVKGILLGSTRAYPGQVAGAAGELLANQIMTKAASGNYTAANAGLTPNSGIAASSGTVAWSQAYWDQAYWDQAYWDVMANYD